MELKMTTLLAHTPMMSVRPLMVAEIVKEVSSLEYAIDDPMSRLTWMPLFIKAAQLKAQKACDRARTSILENKPEWCHVHNIAMKQRGDETKGYWYSHKAPDGSWCRGKAKS
jgi:hypothetical protein